MSDSTALIPHSAPEAPAPVQGDYRPPRPGRTMRSSMRSMVLISGSVGIGTGVALGWFGLAPAVLMAVGLATAQVVAQSFHQSKLGQDVMGGIVGGDLERALRSAEKALEESPAGAMRTLAAANLASVLMQMDRVAEGTIILDTYPPRWPHVPVSTVLWRNNRAFAALVQHKDAGFAGDLLDDAERRLARAGLKNFGGAHNFKKISAAVAGTRAMQSLAAGDPKRALASLERSAALDDAVGAPFRLAEREICRGEALRQLSRRDEAVLTATGLRQMTLTERQRESLEALEKRLGLPTPARPDEEPESDLPLPGVPGFGRL